MAHYKTVQKKMLKEFLTANPENSFSVEDLEEKMREKYGAVAPGRSTMYRLIRTLVESGTVKRLVSGNSRKFIYQIAAGEHCAHHLHMKCTGCGRLLHMDCNDSRRLLNEVLKNTSFFVDQKQTVLMGCCEDCSKEINKGDEK